MAKSVVVSVPVVQNVEDLLESLGGFGRFQVLMLILILGLEIPTAFVVFSPVFTGVTPKDWTCDNETVFTNDEICSCNGTLESLTSSIVSEWNLVCDLAWVSDFITTVQMVGMVVGNCVFGQFADWYGRKKGYVVTVACLSIGTIVSAYSPNMYVYAGARFFCGAGFSGFVLTTGNYAMEFMVPKWRVLCSSVGPFGEGIMLLGVLGYFFQDSWRTFLLATAAPFSLIFIIFPFIPESPRWLLRNQRLEEAQKVFNYMARVNNKPKIDIEILKHIAELERGGGDKTKVKKITYIDFFKVKEVRFVAFCLMIIWGTWVIMYFGISFNIKNLGGNPYLNVVLLGLCDAVGYPTSYIMNSIFSRRQSLASFMTSAAMILVSLAILQSILDVSEMPILVLTMFLLGKFSAAGARATLRTLTGESFPTAVRTTGFGVVCLSASTLGLLAPQIAYLGSRWPSIPLFIFAICSLIGAAFTFLLKETKGQPLTEGVNKNIRKRSSVGKVLDVVRRLSRGGSLVTEKS